jgi:hypothetical protein
MKVLEPSLFIKAKEGRLTWNEANSFLILDEIQKDTESSWGWASSWWQYVTDPDAPPDLIDQMRHGLFSYNMGERLEVLTYNADVVMDNVTLR